MTQGPPSGWIETEKALTRVIKRADFVEALAFILEVAKLAEAADHHPEIDLRYRTVQLSLSTHSAGHTVTAKDYALAQEINDINEDTLRLNRTRLDRFLAV